MVHVTDVPTDLWHIILPLACTDGGFTGTSFAHTCKTLYVLALPYRFYSLALSSLAHLEVFLDLVRRQPGDFRPYIAHLYISHSDHPCRRFQQSWSSMVQMTGAQRRQYRRMVEEAKTDWNARFRVAFEAILNLAAPNLRTLSVAGNCARVILYTLPKLEELAWVGPTLLPDLCDQRQPAHLAMPTGPPVTSTLPVLKRVHFIPGTSSEISPALRSLRVAANTLTHLRISNVHDSTVGAGVPLALAEALAPGACLCDDEDDYEECDDDSDSHYAREVICADNFDDDSTDDTGDNAEGDSDNIEDVGHAAQQTASFRSATLPNLTHIIVRCTPSELGRHIVFADVEPRYLELLAQEFERRGQGTRRMYVFSDRERPEDPELCWSEGLKAEWFHRIDGGRDCWECWECSYKPCRPPQEAR
ncbi:hypothetical protein C8Q70DRAFT_691720 [Cubamyces menziesii]|nr:hypothetical protein C8Q70DRAFT_691720 [Cubamyces menziesii]